MEQTYELLNELKVATEKNFVLKRLFWRVSSRNKGDGKLYFFFKLGYSETKCGVPMVSC